MKTRNRRKHHRTATVPFAFNKEIADMNADYAKAYIQERITYAQKKRDQRQQQPQALVPAKR